MEGADRGFIRTLFIGCRVARGDGGSDDDGSAGIGHGATNLTERGLREGRQVQKTHCQTEKSHPNTQITLRYEMFLNVAQDLSVYPELRDEFSTSDK